MRFLVYASCLAVATSIRRGLVSEANDLEIRAHTEGMTGEVIDGTLASGAKVGWMTAESTLSHQNPECFFFGRFKLSYIQLNRTDRLSYYLTDSHKLF